MAERKIGGVKLRGVAAALPKNVEDNATLDMLTERQRQDVIEKVGIRKRNVADADTNAADLCHRAAEELLNELGWQLDQLELLVFVTQTPDLLLPGTATQLQTRLGLKPNTICIDLNQGCAGYVYGLSVAASMMSSMNLTRGLLLVGDTITKLIDPKDASLRPIFADGGSATALERSGSDEDLMQFRLGAVGSEFEAIHARQAYRNPDGTCVAPTLHMNGQAVFTFGLGTVAKEIRALLDESGLTTDQVDHLLLHQANRFLNDAIMRKTGFRQNQTPASLHEFGNTSCATIPVTLVSQLAEKLRDEHLTLLLSGFGVGLSWGNVILTTDKLVCPEIIFCE